MREQGELDTQIYGKVKANQQAVKREDVVPRAFPSKAEEMKNPPNALKTGNALYATSNMGYGGAPPKSQDQPTKYFPRPEAFTSQFLGGQFQDTGLNTTKTPSRVHSNFDA